MRVDVALLSGLVAELNVEEGTSVLQLRLLVYWSLATVPGNWPRSS